MLKIEQFSTKKGVCIRIISDSSKAREAMIKTFDWGLQNGYENHIDFIDGNIVSGLKIIVEGFGAERKMQVKQILEQFFKFLRGE